MARFGSVPAIICVVVAVESAAAHEQESKRREMLPPPLLPLRQRSTVGVTIIHVHYTLALVTQL
jgi:hypothetical protein